MELARRQVYGGQVDESTFIVIAQYDARGEDVNGICRAILEAAQAVPNETTLVHNRIDNGSARRGESHESQDITIPLDGCALLTVSASDVQYPGSRSTSADIVIENISSGERIALEFTNTMQPSGTTEVRITHAGQCVTYGPEHNMAEALQDETVQCVFFLGLLATLRSL